MADGDETPSRHFNLDGDRDALIRLLKAELGKLQIERLDRARALADQERTLRLKADGSYWVTVPDLEFEWVDIYSEEELSELQSRCTHSWFEGFKPHYPDQSRALESYCRGSIGKSIPVTMHNKLRSREVDGGRVSTRFAFQTAHGAAYGSCGVHWQTIPRFFMKFPLNNPLDREHTRMLEMIMQGWKRKGAGKKVAERTGFTNWYHNQFVVGDQIQEVDAYPSALAMPIKPFEDLCNSQPSDNISYLFFALNPTAAVRMGATGADMESVKVSDPKVTLALQSYANSLKLLAALSIMDPNTPVTSSDYTAKLRDELRVKKKIPVPKIPDGLAERHVMVIKFGEGITPAKRLSAKRKESLCQSDCHHGVEPFTFMAKLSQTWTTHLHAKKAFDFSKVPACDRTRICSIIPGFVGVDQYGLPENDCYLAYKIRSGYWSLEFSYSEETLAREAAAGNSGCLALRLKIWSWLRSHPELQRKSWDSDDSGEETVSESDSDESVGHGCASSHNASGPLSDIGQQESPLRNEDVRIFDYVHYHDD